MTELELWGVTTEPGERPYWEEIAAWESRDESSPDAASWLDFVCGWLRLARDPQ